MPATVNLLEQQAQQVFPGQTIRLSLIIIAPLRQRPAIIQHPMTHKAQHSELAVGELTQAVRVSDLERNANLRDSQIHIGFQAAHLERGPLLCLPNHELIKPGQRRNPRLERIDPRRRYFVHDILLVG